MPHARQTFSSADLPLLLAELAALEQAVDLLCQANKLRTRRAGGGGGRRAPRRTAAGALPVGLPLDPIEKDVLYWLEERAARLPAVQRKRWRRIRQVVLQHAALLGQQGGLYRKGSGRGWHWVLRWYDRTVSPPRHRSCYVGTSDASELVQLVRDLLTLVRAAWGRRSGPVARRGESGLWQRWLRLRQRAEAGRAGGSGEGMAEGPPPQQGTGRAGAAGPVAVRRTPDHGESSERKRSATV